MKDFGKWFSDQAKMALSAVTIPVLPEGIEESGGKFYAYCCCCKNLDEIPCDISEIPEAGYEHYCGRSLHCCP